VISGFGHEVDEICTLVGYARNGGNFMLAFWDNLLFPFSKSRILDR
jgi:hypothetical protein